MHNPELSSIMSRVQRLEAQNRRPQQQETVVQQQEPKLVYLDAEVELQAESITSDKDWTDSGSSQHVPVSAKEVLLWCGIRDTTQGVGTSKMEARANNKVLTIGEIYEPGSGDAQTTLAQCRIPVDRGRFDYRVTLAGGATALYYIIRLVGYFE